MPTPVRRCTCDGLAFHGHDDGCPRITLDRYENEKPTYETQSVREYLEVSGLAKQAEKQLRELGKEPPDRPFLEERVFMHDHISGQPCDVCAFRIKYFDLKERAERMKDALEEIADSQHTDTCDSVLSSDSLDRDVPTYPCTCHVTLAVQALEIK